MLQRTMFLHGLVKVPVIGSRFLAPAAFLLPHCVSKVQLQGTLTHKYWSSTFRWRG
jgi:hypothetical protein